MTITSLTFGTYEKCNWQIFISRERYQRTDPWKWFKVASGAANGDVRNKPYQAHFAEPLFLYGGKILGCYITGDNTRSILCNPSSDTMAENDELRIERGCAMHSTLHSRESNYGDYEFVGSIGYDKGIQSKDG